MMNKKTAVKTKTKKTITSKKSVATKTTVKKPVEIKKSAVDLIWDDIKDVLMDIFALPDQKVNGYFKPITIEPTKLYLRYNVSAALPALETALAKEYKKGAFKVQYEVGLVDKFVTVGKV